MAKYFNKNTDVPKILMIFCTRKSWYQIIYNLENKNDKLRWILKDLMVYIPEWKFNSILEVPYQKIEYFENVDRIIGSRREILSSEFIDIIMSDE